MPKKRRRKASKGQSHRRGGISPELQTVLGAPSNSTLAPQDPAVITLTGLLKDATMRAAEYERLYKDLAAKLTGLLTDDQLSAAKTCGVTPEFYAIEFIELAKSRLFPKFESAIRNFDQLRTGT